jgi:hypothetical protein
MSDDVEARKAAAELWGNELRRAIHASSANLRRESRDATDSPTTPGVLRQNRKEDVMKCARCDSEAVVRVRSHKTEPFEPVCESHRLGIVNRIAQAADKLGRGNENLRAILVLAIDKIEFEDL